MAIINTKLIKYATQARFDIDIAKVPAVIDSKSIVFVEDTGRIYAHGKYFGGAWGDISNKPSTYTPSAHSHGSITNDGKIGTQTNRIIETTTGGSLTHVAKKTAYNKAFGTGSDQVARGNHTHAYLPLSGGELTGDLEIFAGNTDKFIKFAYNTTDAYAWRIGYLGTGAGNENRLAFQSAKTSGASYVDALSFGLDDLVGKFAVTPTVGNTKVSLEGHNHTLKLIAGASTATTDSTADVANPYIRLFSDNAHQGNIQIVGGTNVGVVSKNGVVTLTATNTTYSAGTLALLQTGTNTSNRVWSSKILNDWLNPKLALKATPADISTAINATLPTNTKRDFVNGTLITTSINYSVTNGSPFYMTISGNSYGRINSVDTVVQGYIYNNTIINYGVTHKNPQGITGIVAMNVGGNLCFWFPRQTYWEGYSIMVTTALNYNINTITGITDVVKPAGTKEVNLSLNSKQAAFHNDNLSNFTDNIGVADHIANKSNPHSVTKAQVGLGSVNNTSDANKPISTATQNALNLKFDKTGGRLTTGIGDVNIELWRGTNASWNILNSGGYLRFQSNYTTVVGAYFDALKLDYNTGNALFKGTVTAPSFIGNINASSLNTGTVPNARITGTYTGLTNLTGTGNVDFARFIGNAGDTVTTPSFTWTGDLTTGLYRPAASQVAVTIAGVQRALFTATGITATLNGNASTATALTTSAGSATQPVYFSGGKPVAATAYASASVNYATTAGTATTATTASKLTVNSSASADWFDILWNSGTTIYGSTGSKLRVQPSTGSITSSGTITAAAFSGAFSGSSGDVTIRDTRGASRIPSYYERRAASWDFQESAYTGAGGDTWNVVNTISKWTSFSTAHRQEQIAYTGASLKHRVATSDTVWGDWNTILDSSNSSVSGNTIKINGTSTTWVNTHRGIQNNLTSSSTTESLSANQGRLLATGSARDETKFPISGGILEDYTKKLVPTTGVINLDFGNAFKLDLTTNTNISIVGAKAGAQSFTLIINTGAPARTVTFPASVKWQNEKVPYIGDSLETYILTFMTFNQGVTWFGTEVRTARWISSQYVMATDADFSGTSNGNFVYTGPYKYVIIPHKIKRVTVTRTDYMFGIDASSVSGVATLKGHSITRMDSMFRSSRSDTIGLTLDLSSLNTSNVTRMDYMFQDSRALILDFSSFDTSSVTDMSYMFADSQVNTLDLSSFDTSSVTRMDHMFRSSRATLLDLSSFDTSNASMSYMFNGSYARRGYARTQADANRFNATTYIPDDLNFIVKP